MKRSTLGAIVALACLGPQIQASAADALEQKAALGKLDARLSAMVAQKAAPKAKAGPSTQSDTKAAPGPTSSPYFQPLELRLIDGNKVAVDIIANGNPRALLRELRAMGMTRGAIFGNVVGGAMPVDRLGELNTMAGISSVAPVLARPQAGLVTSRGDTSMNSDVVKSLYGIDGSGVTVGTLSDSFDCTGAAGGAAADVASDDLPAGIDVLEDITSRCIDEGRAMMQLIHDVAPGSDQAFHTAVISSADFANGIIELQQAGSDVIVDDIIYFAEPMFADGIIAQAAQQVADNGSSYFSSAGNNGADSYESAFRDSGETGIFGGVLHDFDPGPGVDLAQTYVLTPGLNVLAFQWDEPYASTSPVSPGSASDVDIIVKTIDGSSVGLPDDFPLFLLGLGGVNANIGGDPVEVFFVFYSGPPLAVAVTIEVFAGPLPNFVKYVQFGGAQAEFAVESATSYGHANAANVAGVGASAWFNTDAFNGFVAGLGQPAALNGFSSLGGVPILFDTEGNRMLKVRKQPRFVGPDGTNTTFFGSDLFFAVPGTNEPDGFPNFFGTSASAPHAAAVAALLLETNPSLTPGEIYDILQDTARDMDAAGPLNPNAGPGFDFATGYGFIDAEAAVDLAATDPRNAEKRFVCHTRSRSARTLSIEAGSVQDHLDHGDKFGPCE